MHYCMAYIESIGLNSLSNSIQLQSGKKSLLIIWRFEPTVAQERICWMSAVSPSSKIIYNQPEFKVLERLISCVISTLTAAAQQVWWENLILINLLISLCLSDMRQKGGTREDRKILNQPLSPPLSLMQLPYHTSPHFLCTEIITLPFHRVTISSKQGLSGPAKLSLFWIIE